MLIRKFRKSFCLTLWIAVAALLQFGVTSYAFAENHFKDDDVSAARLIVDNSPSVLFSMEQHSTKDSRRLPMAAVHAIQSESCSEVTFDFRFDSFVSSAPPPFQHSFVLRL